MVIPFSLVWAYLTLVLASGNGPKLLEALKADSNLGKWVIAFYLLFLIKKQFGRVGDAIFILVLVTVILKIGPDVTDKINKMIDNLKIEGD